MTAPLPFAVTDHAQRSPAILAKILLADLLDAIPYPVVLVGRNLREVAVNSWAQDHLTGLGHGEALTGDDLSGLTISSTMTCLNPRGCHSK